jgi:hypothetical protein
MSGATRTADRNKAAARASFGFMTPPGFDAVILQRRARFERDALMSSSECDRR